MKVISARRIAWSIAAGGTVLSALSTASPVAPAVKAAHQPGQPHTDSQLPAGQGLADKLEQVLRWSLGPGDRIPAGDAPKPGGTSPLTGPEVKKPPPPDKGKPTSRIFLVPLAGREKPRELAANNAVSFLPSPIEIEQIYLIAAGQLQLLDTRSGTVNEIPMSSQMPKDLRLLRLLGYAARTDLLVEIELADHSGPALWQLHVQAGQVTGAQVADDRIKDRTSFFSSFTVPRCQQADRDCLVVKQLGTRSYISKESQADTSTRALTLVKDLSGSHCSDLYGATWASPKTIYVLAACGEQKLL